MSLGLFSGHTMTGFLNDTAASVSRYIQSTKAMFELNIRNIIPKVVESSLRTLIHGPLMPERPIGTAPLARSIVALWSKKIPVFLSAEDPGDKTALWWETYLLHTKYSIDKAHQTNTHKNLGAASFWSMTSS